MTNTRCTAQTVIRGDQVIQCAELAGHTGDHFLENEARGIKCHWPNQDADPQCMEQDTATEGSAIRCLAPVGHVDDHMGMVTESGPVHRWPQNKGPVICPITTTTADDDYDGPALQCVLGIFHGGAHVTSLPAEYDEMERDYMWGSGLSSRLPTTAQQAQEFNTGDLIPILETYRQHWEAVEERLFQNLAHHMNDDAAEDQARALMEDAERDVLHWESIQETRIRLWEGIHEARHGALKAVAALNQLEGDVMYDVEYAEGRTSGYIRSFLETIQRDGAAAWALLLTDEKGNMKP